MKNKVLGKEFYASILTIAIPVIIQNLISLGLNMVDSIMIGALGENPLAAVGVANRVYFVFSMVCFGIYSGSSIFIAQYWGVKDIKSIRKIFGINLTMGTVLSLVTTVTVLLFSREIVRIFIDDPYIIEEGAKYLRIISLSYFFTALSYAASVSSRAIHRLKAITVVNIIAILINVVLNYLLIFGVAGFPRLEVAGAAIATVIARIFEFVVMVLVIYKSYDHPLAGKIKELMSWDFKMFKETLKTSTPVIVNESSWALGTTVYYIAYGMISPAAVAVVQVAYIFNDLFQSVYFGVGNASAIMIGNELGKDEPEKAFAYSKVFLIITLGLNVIISIALFLSRDLIVNFYNEFTPETSEMLRDTIITFSIFMTPKMLTYVFVCGILRAGGDTKFCMILDTVGIWMIGVPLSFISVLVFKLPLHLALALIFSEEIFKLAFLVKRYNSKIWLNKLI